MNQDPLNLSSISTPTWRDIPQPVKPRAMSTGGRLRLALKIGRGLGITALAVGFVWGGWHVLGALRVNSRAMPAEARAVPVKRIELHTTNGGVLDNAWITRTLALPKGIALMELDLPRLRERLLADGQVLTATLTRRFPDVLLVQVSERTPVARINVRTSTGDQVYLVARDGVVYEGSNYDPHMVETLPWLAGLALKPQGAGFRPIANMTMVSDLLARAQYEATHLYLNWHVVSLDRLELDREIEVTTKDGSRYIFSAKADFFPQLAKLDNILEHLRDPERFPTARVARVRIDLSLGREVPVMIEPPATTADLPLTRPALAPGFIAFPRSQSKQPREL